MPVSGPEFVLDHPDLPSLVVVSCSGHQTYLGFGVGLGKKFADLGLWGWFGTGWVVFGGTWWVRGEWLDLGEARL